MPSLTNMKCKPLKAGSHPLPPDRARDLLKGLRGWELAGGKALRQELLMKDFMAAVRFIGRVAEAAEAEDHHPDVHLTGYRRLALELSTHSIGGLSENDFILAAKIDALPRELKS